MAIILVGANSAAGASVALPAHQIGDLLLIFAYRDGSVTAPALPAGWTNINSSGGNTNSSRIGRKVAASTSEVSGTWTNATEIVAFVLRGQDVATPIGAVVGAGASSATISYPALTLNFADGTSWVLGVAGHRAATNVEQAPTGMVNRTSAGTEVAGHDTNGGVTAWTARTIGVNATSGWRAWTVEIRSQSMIRFYLLPVDRQTINGQDKRGPKYFRWKFNPTGLGDPWSWYDYGSLDWGALCSDITQVDHAALILNADVLALPLSLDANMTAGAVTAARNWLEAASLPGNWVTTSDTYRGVLRSTTNIMRYIGRVDALLDYALHIVGINLDATIGSLSPSLRDTLAQVANEFGLDYSAVTGSTTLRQVLKGMADQFSGVPVPFGQLAVL